MARICLSASEEMSKYAVLQIGMPGRRSVLQSAIYVVKYAVLQIMNLQRFDVKKYGE
jgi:hypothetical protein